MKHLRILFSDGVSLAEEQTQTKTNTSPLLISRIFILETTPTPLYHTHLHRGYTATAAAAIPASLAEMAANISASSSLF